MVIKIKTEYRYEYKYRDLCYAVAKAMTHVMKDYGFYGYHYSTSDNGIEIHQLLFLKAVALNRMDVWTLIHRNEYSSSTDFS